MPKPSNPKKETVKISFLTDEKKRNALDAIATQMQRDRSYVLNEAISSYLEIQEWQLQDLQAARKEADADDFATEHEVSEAFGRYIPRK